MNTQSGLLVALLLSAYGQLVLADAIYTSNPGSPYPPSCITGPLRALDLQAENVVKFYSDRIWLEVVHKIESNDPFANLGEARLDMYRLACAEVNRSVIVAEFALPRQGVEIRKAQLLLPWLAGSTGFDPFPLEFKPEANGWGQSQGQFHHSQRAFGDYTGGWDDARRFTWRYVLDVHPQGGLGQRGYASHYYNGFFGLEFFRSDGEPFLAFGVPATEELLNPTGSLPLSGRLSGNWVEQGAVDQGFLISFSNPVPPAGQGGGKPENSQLLVFLSWYTFDLDGEMLWLTGTAKFSQGARHVSIPIELVTGGAFLGGAEARREVVGQGHLQAVSCNQLEFEYHLDALGLGDDAVQLQRLYALEIADYPCRDHGSLEASIYPAERE